MPETPLSHIFNKTRASPAPTSSSLNDQQSTDSAYSRPDWTRDVLKNTNKPRNSDFEYAPSVASLKQVSQPKKSYFEEKPSKKTEISAATNIIVSFERDPELYNVQKSEPLQLKSRQGSSNSAKESRIENTKDILVSRHEEKITNNKQGKISALLERVSNISKPKLKEDFKTKQKSTKSAEKSLGTPEANSIAKEAKTSENPILLNETPKSSGLDPLWYLKKNRGIESANHQNTHFESSSKESNASNTQKTVDSVIPTKVLELENTNLHTTPKPEVLHKNTVFETDQPVKMPHSRNTSEKKSTISSKYSKQKANATAPSLPDTKSPNDTLIIPDQIQTRVSHSLIKPAMNHKPVLEEGVTTSHSRAGSDSKPSISSKYTKNKVSAHTIIKNHENAPVSSQASRDPNSDTIQTISVVDNQALSDKKPSILLKTKSAINSPNSAMSQNVTNSDKNLQKITCTDESEGLDIKVKSPYSNSNTMPFDNAAESKKNAHKPASGNIGINNEVNKKTSVLLKTSEAPISIPSKNSVATKERKTTGIYDTKFENPIKKPIYSKNTFGINHVERDNTNFANSDSSIKAVGNKQQPSVSKSEIKNIVMTKKQKQIRHQQFLLTNNGFETRRSIDNQNSLKIVRQPEISDFTNGDDFTVNKFNKQVQKQQSISYNESSKKNSGERDEKSKVMKIPTHENEHSENEKKDHGRYLSQYEYNDDFDEHEEFVEEYLENDHIEEFQEIPVDDIAREKRTDEFMNDFVVHSEKLSYDNSEPFEEYNSIHEVEADSPFFTFDDNTRCSNHFQKPKNSAWTKPPWRPSSIYGVNNIHNQKIQAARLTYMKSPIDRRKPSLKNALKSPKLPFSIPSAKKLHEAENVKNIANKLLKNFQEGKSANQKAYSPTIFPYQKWRKRRPSTLEVRTFTNLPMKRQNSKDKNQKKKKNPTVVEIIKEKIKTEARQRAKKRRGVWSSGGSKFITQRNQPAWAEKVYPPEKKQPSLNVFQKTEKLDLKAEKFKDQQKELRYRLEQIEMLKSESEIQSPEYIEALIKLSRFWYSRNDYKEALRTAALAKLATKSLIVHDKNMALVRINHENHIKRSFNMYQLVRQKKYDEIKAPVKNIELAVELEATVNLLISKIVDARVRGLGATGELKCSSIVDGRGYI